MPETTPPPAAGQSSPTDIVGSLMPQLRSDLERLVRIPSVSSAGYPEPRRPLLDAYELIVDLLRDAGVQSLGSLELPTLLP